jgi:hypothetical protein
MGGCLTRGQTTTREEQVKAFCSTSVSEACNSIATLGLGQSGTNDTFFRPHAIQILPALGKNFAANFSTGGSLIGQSEQNRQF